MKYLLTVLLILISLSMNGCATLKKAFQKKTKEPEQSKKEETPPNLMAPIVKRIWIPAKIEGDKYIDGHFVYVIERGSQWTK